MEKTDFDEIISLPFENEMIEYGIIKGNNTVFFTKAGANGSMRGYQDKYLKMGLNLHKKYGFTIVCSSNPFAYEESIGQAIDVIEQYVKGPYQIYYFGHSNGATMGARYAWKYPQIKRLVLVNGPIMINWHQTKTGISQFQGEQMALVYGAEDFSAKFIGMFDLIDNPAKSVHIIEGADHHFVGLLEDFIALPEKYLMFS
ncbi:MAG: alpha/beta hydrolase [Alphaproteobacteria bacterium]|nr:alpha/beta hydrolase [Alphaproteobacteria bacterium]